MTEKQPAAASIIVDTIFLDKLLRQSCIALADDEKERMRSDLQSMLDLCKKVIETPVPHRHQEQRRALPILRDDTARETKELPAIAGKRAPDGSLIGPKTTG